MYLKSLEISGFKSFAKKAALNFTSPISAIVGPNGSGKSNVAEAFSFVLGEQSIKSLRGKRGEDLIWNGGNDSGAKTNRASVKVVFDNSRRLLNIDFDEVTIERVVHRDNANEYLINGSPSRLKDIVELLSGAHIGASGHHIISQGEADRILNANSKERREMIEDALGLKIYQYKKTESQRKLEKTEENMQSVESLRKEIAPHLKFLKKQVEKIEKVQELRQELRGLYQEYFRREEDYLKSLKAEIETKKAPIKSEMTALDAELGEAKRILESSKNKDKKSEELITIEAKIQKIRFDKDNLNHELGKIEGEISALEKSIQREKEKHSRDEYKTVYLKDVEDVAKKINILESISEIKKIITDFIFFHKHKDESLDIEEIKKELDIFKIRREALENSIKETSSREDEIVLEYNTLRQKIEKEKDSNRDAEKNIFRIIARQNELRGMISGLKSKEETLLIEEESFKKELQEAYLLAGREGVDYKEFPVSSHEDRTKQAERKKNIERIKIRIEDSGFGNSSDVIKEHREVEERDTFLSRELSDLEASKKSLIEMIADLDTRLDMEFREGILKINSQFQEFFALMFGGGSASLEAIKEEKRKKKSDTDISSILSGEEENEEEESEDGIEIHVNLPRKKVKSLMMLSGGERALTSIALLFAISQVNPPPFIILDETDAALDEANSKKYGDMISNLSKYSQLILITHNRETMSRAGILYGITMGSDGSSRLLSIQFDEAVKVAK